MHQPCPLCLLIGALATVAAMCAASVLWCRAVARDARAEDDEDRAWSG